MRLVLSCAALALMGGCAVVPPEAWSFDPAQPPAKEAMSPQDVAPLTDRMAQLQLQRNAIRDRIASERSAWARQSLYQELHDVGMELSPLERRLARVAAAR